MHAFMNRPVQSQKKITKRDSSGAIRARVNFVLERERGQSDARWAPRFRVQHARNQETSAKRAKTREPTRTLAAHETSRTVPTTAAHRGIGIRHR